MQLSWKVDRHQTLSLSAYSLPCSGEAHPPFGGEGQSWYFVSRQNTKQKGRQLAEEGKLKSLLGLPLRRHLGKKVLEQICPNCVLHCNLPKQVKKKVTAIELIYKSQSSGNYALLLK